MPERHGNSDTPHRGGGEASNGRTDTYRATRPGSYASGPGRSLGGWFGWFAFQELFEVFRIDAPEAANLERLELTSSYPVVDGLTSDAELFSNSRGR